MRESNVLFQGWEALTPSEITGRRQNNAYAGLKITFQAISLYLVLKLITKIKGLLN